MPDEHLDAYIEHFGDFDPEVFIRMAEKMAVHTAGDLLEKVAAPVLVGSPDPHDAARAALARTWAQRFADAGIPSETTTNLFGELWAKVFYNSALNPLGALLRVPYGHLPDDPDTRALMDRLIDEAFAVA